MIKRIKCLIGFHGCYCEDWFCSKPKHAWDGCICTLCGTTRGEGHTWDGCKCNQCGTTRDEGHVWDGCKCTLCGTTRNEGHAWDRCKCSRCGISNDDNSLHAWNTCDCSMGAHVCNYCEEMRLTEHIDLEEIENIFECPKCKYAVSKNLVAYPGKETTLMLLTLAASVSLSIIAARGRKPTLGRTRMMDPTYKSIHDIGCMINEMHGSNVLKQVIGDIYDIEKDIKKETFSPLSLDNVYSRLLMIWREYLNN